MRHLRAFFNYCIKRGHLTENPTTRLDFVEVTPKEVEVISPEGVAKMLETALKKDLGLLPYLTLGFFCGIRPVGELNLLLMVRRGSSEPECNDPLYCVKDETATISRTL